MLNEIEKFEGARQFQADNVPIRGHSRSSK
jgi:hypothetical protein